MAPAGTVNYDVNANVTIKPDQIPVSSENAIASLPYGDSIIDACNQHLTANGPTDKQTFPYSLGLTFAVQAMEGTSANVAWPPFAAKKGSFDITVVCDPFYKAPSTASSVKSDHGPYKVTGVDLKVQQIAQLHTAPSAPARASASRWRRRRTRSAQSQ